MWPNNKRCAVLLTFDFDAETLWEAHFEPTPTYLSRGTYGARVGLPRILKLLDKYHIPATFFIPGLTAERYPHLVREIQAGGHEIGHHGYHHTSPVNMTLQEESDVLEQGIRALESITGQRPQGYRSPSWDLSHNSVRLFQQFGFLYDSSMMADDFHPYRLTLDKQEIELVELPVAWELDDAPYFMFNFTPYRAGLSDPAKVYDIWAAEFDGAYAEEGVFTLTMHPQITGRHYRLQLLDKLIRYIAGHPDVWFTRCSEVARTWLAASSAERLEQH